MLNFLFPGNFNSLPLTNFPDRRVGYDFITTLRKSADQVRSILWCLIMSYMIHDIWYRTYDIWHMIHAIWHMIHDNDVWCHDHHDYAAFRIDAAIIYYHDSGHVLSGDTPPLSRWLFRQDITLLFTFLTSNQTYLSPNWLVNDGEEAWLDMDTV